LLVRSPIAGIALILVLLIGASSAGAHGARVIWEIREDSVLVSAAFDDGMPMDSAQVTVFSGAAPSEPWLTGFTDDRGEFAFLPDRSESSDWDVQVRKAGHGDIVHLSLQSDAVHAGGGGGFSALQTVLMSACVVWGFIGTAFFFASRRKKG
jgi:nickel transport protein